MFDPLSIIVGAVAGAVVGALCIVALIRAAEFIEGPLGAAEYATRHPVRYGRQADNDYAKACAALLTDAETSAARAGRHDIAIRIHDVRGELADWNAA
jgi:hypothetical protein